MTHGITPNFEVRFGSCDLWQIPGTCEGDEKLAMSKFSHPISDIIVPVPLITKMNEFVKLSGTLGLS